MRKITGGDLWAKPTGGAQRLPLIPWQWDGPKRGVLYIPESFADRPGTLLHEIFHTFEARFEIQPIHGFRSEVRSAFPDWKGSGEWDFYSHHLGRVSSSVGLSNFIFAGRDGYAVTAALFAANREAAALAGPGIRRAFGLSEEARRNHPAFASDATNEALYARALGLNPSCLPALRGLGMLRLGAKDPLAAKALFERAWALDPGSADTAYWMGVTEANRRDTETAALWFRRALALEPGDRRPAEYLGRLRRE
ncbi:MAG: hypothetical protein J0L75_06160 [Spirochaetes bacterium]|nr:hypothetical protein [Spirochaetota bacterium]